MAKLTKRTVDAVKPGERDFVLWDSELKGFGLRVRPSGARTYIVQYRAGRGRAAINRKVSIGRHGSPWTPDRAREEARRLLGAVANGSDPAADRARERRDMTVGDLCDLYLAEGCDHKKNTTLATDRGRIERHIRPLLGRKRIGALTSTDIEKFLRDVAKGKTEADVKTRKHGRAIVRGGRGTASRTTGLLGGILTFAVKRKLISVNPVHGVPRYPDGSSMRFLSAEELVRLGSALRDAEAEGANTKAIAIIRLLALTGGRLSEISALQWSYVRLDDECIVLPDSKTGAKIIRLGAPALQLLVGLTGSLATGPVFVFPNEKGTGSYQGVAKIWRLVRAAAEIKDVRLHDLRHSFASVGVSRGESLPIIGALLGHADAKSTSRYAHLSDDPVRSAAQSISSTIADSLGLNEGPEDGEVKILPAASPAKLKQSAS